MTSKHSSRMSSSESQCTSSHGSHLLGLLSLGIAFAEIAAPQKVQNLLGLQESKTNEGILRVLGTRELLHGLSLLTATDHSTLAAGAWSRVLGDVLDTTLFAMAAPKTQAPARFAALGAGLLAIGAADLNSAKNLSMH